MIKRMAFLALLSFWFLSAHASTSTCYGTTSNGRLEGGVVLPLAGDNFEAYSVLGVGLGRTFVHSEVKKIVVDAYAYLNQSLPKKKFKYAETGFQSGGKFSPHKTHQNGLSVDFMTPVINKKGESVHLHTHAMNKYGYDIEFNSKGVFKGLSIDYEAMAAHLVALHKEAEKHGHDIWRVIFDPKLQPGLLASSGGEYLKKHIQFSKKPSWVRHDEHYHVDFSVPCAQSK